MYYKEYLAYKKSFELAMTIYELSKTFPTEERYSLTDQIRRSSRSVCANLAEASRKVRYANYFISKLSDSDAENSETGVWLEFAFHCAYITNDQFKNLCDQNDEVGKLINNMIRNPQKFGSPQ